MPQIDTGDTAWVLASAALVLLMTPGLAFFYGGLVRAKNAINTIMLSFITIGLIGLQFVLVGYSLGFGPDKLQIFGADRGGLIGGLDWIGLRGVGAEPGPYAATIPHQTYMIFQAMFAIITPALITGAFVERMKFGAFLIFILAWATLVYDPVAHWVWGGGWLAKIGALDFAGGTVVHITAGVSALAAALVIGRRKGFGQEPMQPHSVPFVVLGAGLLWFGWFGFNAGSALGANFLASNAFVVTNTAACTAALTWTLISWAHTRHPSVIGAASGAVAGLVAITPASGYVTPMASILIGLGAGAICYLAVQLRVKLKFDDALDVWAVHGMGGTWGAIATGLFATKAINAAGDNGLFYGNPAQLGEQFIAVVATWIFSFVVTYVLLKVIDMVIGLRVDGDAEERGLDVAEHGEPAYAGQYQ